MSKQSYPKKSTWSDPSQSQKDKLDRFEKLSRGASQSGGDQPQPAVLLKVLNDKSVTGFDPSPYLHGPLQKEGNTPENKARILIELSHYRRTGKMNVFWEKCQQEAAAIDPFYKNNFRGVNFVIPVLVPSDSEMPFFQNSVILSDPDDCQHIARAHIKKQPNFSALLFQSLIATTDNVHWAKQRNYLNEVFLPQSSLSKIFPTSWKRAKFCANKLATMSTNAGPYGVQMHDFFLHEAQAQLQLALFGMDEAFMEETNVQIRDVFAGVHKDPKGGFGSKMVLDMLKKVGENENFGAPTDPDVINGTKALFGPLSKAVHNAATDLDMNIYDQFGNMMLILFAGHDTTAHTMTWCAYELAHHPHYQRRVQQEVDALFADLNGKDMVYEDCVKLPFLTKCVMETLRLWTAVPNGTFRELQYDDEVRGPGGKMVTLKKGTFVQVCNLMRQRNVTLWGKDAEEFNPDREWQGNEIWGMSDATNPTPYHGSNPNSPRFSPFTFTPRDCLGKNFAQMEMRTILANVFHRFNLELSAPYSDVNVKKNGGLECTGATMGPMDMTPEGLETTRQRMAGLAQPNKPKMAMYLHAVPRARTKL